MGFGQESDSVPSNRSCLRLRVRTTVSLKEIRSFIRLNLMFSTFPTFGITSSKMNAVKSERVKIGRYDNDKILLTEKGKTEAKGCG